MLWHPARVSRDVVSAMWGPVLKTLMSALTPGLEMTVVSLYCSIKGPNIHLDWIIPFLCYSTATWNLQLASIKDLQLVSKYFGQQRICCWGIWKSSTCGWQQLSTPTLWLSSRSSGPGLPPDPPHMSICSRSKAEQAEGSEDEETGRRKITRDRVWKVHNVRILMSAGKDCLV